MLSTLSALRKYKIQTETTEDDVVQGQSVHSQAIHHPFRMSLEWKCDSLKSKTGNSLSHSHKLTDMSVSSASFSPVTAAQEGAQRPLIPTELSRARRVCTLCDEGVQISDAYLLLSLGLWKDDKTCKY